MPARFSIIGAGGRIGRFLLANLSGASGCQAVGICRNEVTAAPLRLRGYEVRVGEINTPREAERLLDGSDVVVDSTLATGLLIRPRRQAAALLHSVLEACAGTTVVHFSSVAVYGVFYQHGLGSFARPAPQDRYGRFKLFCERLARNAARHKGANLLVWRLGNVIGPGQDWSLVIVNLLLERPYALPFDGQMPSNCVHARSIADALIALPRSPEIQPHGVFNFVSCPQLTWRSVFEYHAAASGCPTLPGMPSAESKQYRNLYAAQRKAGLGWRLLQEIARATAGLPAYYQTRCPAVKEAAENLVALSGSQKFEAWLQRRSIVRTTAGAVQTRPAKRPNPALFWDAVPGPEYPCRGIDLPDTVDLAEWYQRLFAPAALKAQW